MLAMSFLQEGPNTSLVWLFYVLLAFLFLVIIVGALASREKQDLNSEPKSEIGEEAAKPKSAGKTRRLSSRKKSK